jgi:DNA-binding CsgD family transcriptional regulator
VSNLMLREVQCLAWVAERKTDAEILAILGVHTKTVNLYVERIKREGLRRDAAAGRRARRSFRDDLVE